MFFVSEWITYMSAKLTKALSAQRVHVEEINPTHTDSCFHISNSHPNVTALNTPWDLALVHSSLNYGYSYLLCYTALSLSTLSDQSLLQYDFVIFAIQCKVSWLIIKVQRYQERITTWLFQCLFLECTVIHGLGYNVFFLTGRTVIHGTGRYSKQRHLEMT